MASATTFTTPAALEQAARNYRELVMAACKPRKIIAGQRSANIAFQLLGDRVIKVILETTSQDIFYNWSANSVETKAPVIDVLIGAASENDLVLAKKIAHRSQHARLDELISLVRKTEQPSPPVRAEIIQPKARSKILTITRAADGKISGGLLAEV
jgi:hypothetical protein